MKPDVTVVNHGSIFIVSPVTPKANRWVKKHLSIESWQYFGKGFSVDQHYIENLVDGMRTDGQLIVVIEN